MTGPRTRRTLLRVGAAAVAGLGGCVGGLGGGAGDDGTEATTRTSSAVRKTTENGTTSERTTDETSERATDETTRTTAETPAVDVVPERVQSSFFYLTTPDSMGVAAVEGEQFAFVGVTPGSDDLPSVSDFALIADGDRYPATATPGPIHDPYRLYEQGHVYDPEDGRAGWLAFEVPDPLDAEDVVVASDDHEQSVGDEFRADLREPPADFELVSFDAPDRVGPDEYFDVTCTVRNVGPGDGTFRACLNQSGPMYAPHTAEFPVAAGERRTWVWTFGQHVSAETERVGFRFRSAVADREESVEVTGGSTTTR